MVIDLGSGLWPKKDADVHVDINSNPHVEVKHDLNVFPYPFRDSCAEKIYLHDVIEHITIFKVELVLREIHRILMRGGVLDITCPDVDWIAHRIVNRDWKEKAKGSWLNKFPDDFVNAMNYMFGGYYDLKESTLQGAGHVAGYDFDTLYKQIMKSVMNPWASVRRVSDPRNECILRIQAIK